MSSCPPLPARTTPPLMGGVSTAVVPPPQHDSMSDQPQRPGGSMLRATDFLRGFPIEQGRVLPTYALPILADTKPFPVDRKG